MVKTYREVVSELMRGKNILDDDFWKAYFEGIYPKKIVGNINHFFVPYLPKIERRCYLNSKTINVLEDSFIINIIAIKDNFIVSIHHATKDFLIAVFDFNKNQNKNEFKVMIQRNNSEVHFQAISSKIRKELKKRNLIVDWQFVRKDIGFIRSLNSLLVTILWDIYLSINNSDIKHILEQIKKDSLLEGSEIIEYGKQSSYSNVRKSAENVNQEGLTSDMSLKTVYSIDEGLKELEFDDTELQSLDKTHHIVARWQLLIDSEPNMDPLKKVQMIAQRTNLDLNKVIAIGLKSIINDVNDEALKLKEQFSKL